MTNTLDNLTILRFAHAFRSGGGVEQHLNDVDGMLLKRNRAKIIRLCLEKDLSSVQATSRAIGQGTLVEIPLPIKEEKTQAPDNKYNANQSAKSFVRSAFRDLLFFDPYKISRSRITLLNIMFREHIVYNPFLYHAFFRRIFRKYSIQQRRFEVINAGKEAKKIFEKHQVNLLVMHYVGGVDSAEIIDEAKKQGIPYIFINHFSNDSFTNFSVREQISNAAGIAGVTDVGVPKRLKANFYNVSDGIDIEMFNPDRARSIEFNTNDPIIFYPARITRVKGQSDLIKAYTKLKSYGLRAKIVFAGRVDSSEYEEELKGLVRKNGLIDDVLFIGQLNTEELRDWYGISSVLAFPTYHQEGLPRILMEAQAMKVPPVVYLIGGTSGAIQDGKTGFLVQNGDLNSFTNRLRVLITNEEERKRMGENGRMFVKNNFSLDSLAERHEKLYVSVLKKK